MFKSTPIWRCTPELVHLLENKINITWLHIFSWQTQKFKNKSLLSLEKKRLLEAWLPVKFVMLSVWSIAVANWFACLHKCNCMGLIDKPAYNVLCLLYTTCVFNLVCAGTCKCNYMSFPSTGFELSISQSQNAIYFCIIAIPKKSHCIIFLVQNFV